MYEPIAGELAGGAIRRRPRFNWTSLLSHRRNASGAASQEVASERPRLPKVLAALSTLAGEIADEGKRILAGSMQVALQNRTQSDRLTAARKTIDELERITGEISDTLVKSELRIKKTQDRLEFCSSIAQNRGLLFKDLMVRVQRSGAALTEVDERVREVERFLAIIQEIGEQTTLLALNAAIEAARAGAHGTSFNVVAREMRVLADRTRRATDSISGITERMRTSAAETAAFIHLANEASELDQAKGTQALTALSEAIGLLHESEASASHIAEEAKQQREEVQHLHRSWDLIQHSALDRAFDADTAAETSMCTVSLAASLYDELGALTESVEAHGRGPVLSFGHERSLLKETARTCRTVAGLADLEQHRPKIEAALRDLQVACLRWGTPSRRSLAIENGNLPELCFGSRPVNQQHELVDSVGHATGLTATLFVLAEDPGHGLGFYCIATNVGNAKGKRAVNTPLNRYGRAARLLLRGESTYGYAYILGVPHIAAYAPILDPGGQIVGATYTGRSLARPAAEPTH